MDQQQYIPQRRVDIEFEKKRARFYLTAVHRVMVSESFTERTGILGSQKVHIQGIPYTLPSPIQSGPQCVTVPLQLARNKDLARVEGLGDRMAMEAGSSFTRVYRHRAWVMAEFTLPPEQWLKVRVRDLPHRKGQPAFGELSLGQVARMEFNENPHKLISGRTRSGKTTTQAALVWSLAKTHDPGELRIMILNPKGDPELDKFGRLPHLKNKIAHTYEECEDLLRLAVAEMEMRKRHRELCAVRWIIFADEIQRVIEMKPAAGPAVAALIAEAGALRINLVAATQNPLPSAFGPEGAKLLANFGSYIMFQLPNGNSAYYGSGGISGIRTAELGGGSTEGEVSGKGDGYIANGGIVRRFRGAYFDDRDIASLPRLETEPESPDPVSLAGDAALDTAASGIKWEIDDLADKAGYALALADKGLAPTANRLFKQFKGSKPWSMDRAQWVRDFAKAVASRIEYWDQSQEILALVEGKA